MLTRGIPGVGLCLVGALFIGQGTDAIHGSTMSGQAQWAVVGGVLVVLGLALLTWAWRIRGGRTS